MQPMQYAHYEHEPLPGCDPSLCPAEKRGNLLIARAAVGALYQELSAYPKPGLVSPVDSGSHRDMDASTFMRSLFSLRGYFRDIACAGMRDVRFDELRRLGREAEFRMLKATGGVNTHRGAIFGLGLLAAAAGFLLGIRQPLEGRILSHVIREQWGADILRSAPQKPCSHGTLVTLHYGVAGARQEAAEGFPHVFGVGLPALQRSILRGSDAHAATIQSFFSIMAVLPDTNLLYRGGEAGLSFAQEAARSFLDDGGVHRDNWQAHAGAIHREFVTRRLSPGGSADLLAASIFVHRFRTQLRNDEER